jgi:hypothetical protein
MIERSDWLAHGDDLLVDSLHDILEGPKSIAPLAMVPPKPPAGRSGMGAIVAVGILLGLVIGVSMRLVYAAPAAAAPPAIAARLSAPLLDQLTIPETNRTEDPATGGQADDENARISEDDSSKPKPKPKRKRRARRSKRDSSPEDIYAQLDSLDGISSPNLGPSEPYQLALTTSH